MFKDINFRYTDAQEEKLYAPELIEKAYVDIDNILEEIERPEKFIVIGPKGAGKSAFSSKLQLNAKNRWNLFVSGDELEQFEFNLLEKTGAEKGRSIGGAITVWQMLLALRFIPLFLSDESIRSENRKLIKFHESLMEYGFSSSESLIKIVQYTSRRGIFATIKKAFLEFKGEIVEEEQSKIKDPAAIVDAIKTVFSSISPTESSYYLVIDGLDHPIRNGRNNASYIADLINGVRSLNGFFKEIDLSAKVIILIRDEILSLVPDPNLTKRINDNGILLRWYDNTRSPFDTSLFGILEKRAYLAGYEQSAESLWNSWFPEKINRKDSVSFVLDNTRYLPRDLISFFRELQNLREEPPFSRENVLAALNNYSEWYLQELSDALVGLINEKVRNDLPAILSELGRDFTFEEFVQSLGKRGVSDRDEASLIAKELFNTSFIGNFWSTAQNTERFSFKHRKKNAVLNEGMKIRLHAGLWKALNLV